MENFIDLREAFPADSMHDQQITNIVLSSGTLSLNFDDLHFNTPYSPESQKYYDEHKSYHKCTLTFSGLEEADLYAEVKKKKERIIEVIEYYDDEFIEFLKSNQFRVEISNFFYGYGTALIQGTMVNRTGSYGPDCLIKISSDTVLYQWHS